MSIKRKLKQYVEDMHIPPADHVLPEGVCRKANEKKSVPHGKYRYYIGMAGTVAACAVIMSLVVWQPWKNVADSDVMNDALNGAMAAPDGNLADVNNGYSSDDNALNDTPAAVGEGDDEYSNGAGVPDSTPAAEGKYGDGEIVGDYPLNSVDLDGLGGDGAYLEGEAVDEALSAAGVKDEPAAAEVLEEPAASDLPDYQAGVLTGGEIRDLRNWDNWLRALSTEYMEQWNMVLQQRVSVYVHSQNTPLNNVRVRLLQDEEVLYEAVTNATGNAYLFYQYKADSGQKPTGIQVQASDGSWLSYDYSQNYANDQVLDVELEQENQTVKVDLMYVIDTTGSMGDELEYLKVEIQDVIERAAEQTGAEIRTSVNFYRDEGDEYVVKYYDFREDAGEVAALVAGQSANGGGDEPEAVHTALDNALHQHSWSEDSTVRLMFLVLDAPPHSDEDVKAQILSLTEEAAAMGVRIIPVAASGAGEDTQQLLRSMAIMTGGTFIFLDDNSGVGYGHTVTVKPEEYDSEYLNEMMIRIIGEYCGTIIDIHGIEATSEAETTEFVQ